MPLTCPLESVVPAPATLAALLLGDDAPAGLELPATSELLAAITALTTGARRKALLPLPGVPAELALVRAGERVTVTAYDTGPTPEILLAEHAVPADLLRQAAIAAAQASVDGGLDPLEQQVLRRLIERACQLAEPLLPDDEAEPVQRRGGQVVSPGPSTPLAFGYAATIQAATSANNDATNRADVHALLFEGTLHGYVRGRRIELARGPIMLPALRMLQAARLLVDSWQAGRCANVRLRTGRFLIGLRLDRSGEVTVCLGGVRGAPVTAGALDVPGATLPILRLVSELLRTLSAVDRAQSRNLRVRSTREEIRALRRSIRAHHRRAGFVNLDPDRLRVADVAEPAQPAQPPSHTPTVPVAALTEFRSSLRFSERWHVDIDEVDAAATFLCGDRVVLASPRRALALSRDHGELLWSQHGNWSSTLMAGTTLVHVGSTGDVELCDVETGEAFAHSRLSLRKAQGLRGHFFGYRSAPPAVVFADGPERLIAVDLRTGQSRWDFTTQSPTALRVTRFGRVLLAASGHAVDAIDVTTGEVVWRVAIPERLAHGAVVVRDTALLVASSLGESNSVLYGIDVFTGEAKFRHPLDARVHSAPFSMASAGGVCVGVGRQATLMAVHPETGAPDWTIADPGLASGAAALAVDQMLIVNAPSGRVTAIDVATGHQCWRRDLADPVTDELPRTLEPILRGGALFIPAASVHVLRPTDGCSIGQPLPSSLIPDWIRIDERGWAYIAEESGHIGAYAPVPHLTLLPGLPGTRHTI